MNKINNRKIRDIALGYLINTKQEQENIEKILNIKDNKVQTLELLRQFEYWLTVQYPLYLHHRK